MKITYRKTVQAENLIKNNLSWNTKSLIRPKISTSFVNIFFAFMITIKMVILVTYFLRHQFIFMASILKIDLFFYLNK